MPIIFYILFSGLIISQDQEPKPGTLITGVYQGKMLFIQNPFNAETHQFCIEQIILNNNKLAINTDLSAIILDFKSLDINTPVNIRIIHKDSCNPIIINPDAIFFHSTFSFRDISLTDTLLTWKTVGDKSGGTYIVEKMEGGIWREEESVTANGIFEGSTYQFVPSLREGANKYRVRYNFPYRGRYLYSNDVDMHYYPDPVTFHPKKTSEKLIFSRNTFYQIYDKGSNMVLDGTGREADVSRLPRGDYVIYFDGDDPGAFAKE